MKDTRPDEVRAFWNAAADDWDRHVGDEGDDNRRLNSDPVLWRFAGEVAGLHVLDAGCGTGYLARKLHEKGARVTGIDLSERMVALSRRKHPDITFHRDSCATLGKLPSEHFDLVVSNYVLMDTPDLQASVNSIFRVLKPGGCAAIIFSHPCFPQGQATVSESSDSVSYLWKHSYFSQSQQSSLPWGHFRDHFIWFHRPLSDYWKAFTEAGFRIEEFEEPRILQQRYHMAENKKRLDNAQTRPYSVAFKLRKPSHTSRD